jgi:squalene-associated FAD-dependent desaturase
MRGRHILVAGAGLAGLSAALHCADLGARVTVLERRRRVGGLTASFEHSGLTFDNGQHVFLACCREYLGFLRRIGSDGYVVAPRPLDIPVVAPGLTGRLRRQDLPVPLHMAGSLMRYPHASVASRLRLGRALVGLARLDLDNPALDDVTFGDWLRAHGQAGDAVASVWDLITVPTVNLPAADASLAVAAMVMKTALLTGRDAADIGWSAVPLGQLHGRAATTAITAAGGTVRTGTRVLAVDQNAGGWTVHTNDGPLDADGVVVALPHEEASAVLPAGTTARQGRWPDLGSSAVVDVHLVFDRQVSPWEFFAGHRCAVQWVFDRSQASGLRAAEPDHQYLSVSLSAADALLPVAPEVIVRDTVDALAQLLPAARGARLVDSLVTKERRATFAARPGTAALRPAAATSRRGLAMAGAWAATGWPATMEGAVRSGRAAAEHLSRSLPARTVPTPQEVA